MFNIQINNRIERKLKLTVALLTAAWMSTGICAQHASTASGNASQSGAKKSVHAKKQGKKTKVARSGKNNAGARDGDAEVLAQVLGSDSKNPLWSKSGQ